MARTPKWDREIVSLIARVKFVRAEHVARRFEMTVRNANMRLNRLTDVGFLLVENRLPGGRLFAATRDGIDYANLDLDPVQFSYASIEHDLAIAEFVVACEAEGYETLAERELAAEARASDGQRFSVICAARQGVARHLPDAAFLTKSGEYIAIEIELSNKSVFRTRAILNGFSARMDSFGLRGVLYLVGGRCSAVRMSKFVDDLALEDCVEVAPHDGQIPAEALRTLVKKSRHRERCGCGPTREVAHIGP